MLDYGQISLGVVILLAMLSSLSMVTAQDSSKPPITIVLVGDSTVSNYRETAVERGWGQFLQERFNEGSVRVVNLAAGGRSTKTFISEGRWEKTLAEKPNYIFIQMGHNDSHAAEKPESTDASTDYRDNLRRYVREAREIGATPILITSVVRRTFNSEGRFDEPAHGRSLTLYAQAMRAVASEEKVTLIDLYASSKALAEKLGPQASADFANKPGDITHFNEKGARAMCDLLVADLPKATPQLAELLKKP